jgi:hypothetical protein
LGEIRAIKGEISNLPREYAYSLSHDRDTFWEILLITSSRRLGFSVWANYQILSGEKGRNG